MFDPSNLDPYLFALCSIVDEQVFTSSTRRCAEELTDIHGTALGTIAGRCLIVEWSGVEWSGGEGSGVEWSGVEWRGVA